MTAPFVQFPSDGFEHDVDLQQRRSSFFADNAAQILKRARTVSVDGSASWPSRRGSDVCEAAKHVAKDAPVACRRVPTFPISSIRRMSTFSCTGSKLAKDIDDDDTKVDIQKSSFGICFPPDIAGHDRIASRRASSARSDHLSRRPSNAASGHLSRRPSTAVTGCDNSSARLSRQPSVAAACSDSMPLSPKGDRRRSSVMPCAADLVSDMFSEMRSIAARSDSPGKLPTLLGSESLGKRSKKDHFDQFLVCPSLRRSLAWERTSGIVEIANLSEDGGIIVHRGPAQIVSAMFGVDDEESASYEQILAKIRSDGVTPELRASVQSTTRQHCMRRRDEIEHRRSGAGNAQPTDCPSDGAACRSSGKSYIGAVMSRLSSGEKNVSRLSSGEKYMSLPTKRNLPSLPEVPRLRSKFRDERPIMGGRWMKRASTARRDDVRKQLKAIDEVHPNSPRSHLARVSEEAALQIQSAWRLRLKGRRTRQKQRVQFLSAVLNVQLWWRKMIRKRRKSAVRIQAAYRGWKMRQRLRTQQQLHSIAWSMQQLQFSLGDKLSGITADTIVPIQACIRGFLARRQLAKRREAVDDVCMSHTEAEPPPETANLFSKRSQRLWPSRRRQSLVATSSPAQYATWSRRPFKRMGRVKSERSARSEMSDWEDSEPSFCRSPSKSWDSPKSWRSENPAAEASVEQVPSDFDEDSAFASDGDQTPRPGQQRISAVTQWPMQRRRNLDSQRFTVALGRRSCKSLKPCEAMMFGLPRAVAAGRSILITPT